MTCIEQLVRTAEEFVAGQRFRRFYSSEQAEGWEERAYDWLVRRGREPAAAEV